MSDVARILEAYGQAQAEAARQQGAVWGQAVQNIGQIPQQIQQSQLLRAREQRLAEEAEAQRQLTGLKLHEYQQQQQERSAVDNVLGQDIWDRGRFDTQKAIAIAKRNGFTAHVPKLLEIGERWNELADKSEQSRAKLQEENQNHLGLAAAMVDPSDEGSFQALMGQAVQSGWLSKEDANRYLTMPPASRAGTLNSLIGASKEARAATEVTGKPGETIYQRNLRTGVLTPQVTTPPKREGEWGDYAASYAKSKGAKSFDDLSPTDQLSAYTAFSTAKQTPESAELAGLRETMLRLQIGQQPTREDAGNFARQLVEHKLAPSQIQLFGGFGAAGAAFKRMVGTEALKLDPNFDWEEAQSTFDLAKSPAFQNTVRYMDAVTESIPRLMQNATKLANGRFKTWNAILNAGKEQFSDTDLKAFKTDALLVGDEVAKILQGGGTGSGTSDAKLKQAQDLINTSDSVPAIASAMTEVQALIANRRRSLVRGTYYERQGASAPAPSGPPSATAKTVTLAELAAIAKRRGTTVDQERERYITGGYAVVK